MWINSSLSLPIYEQIVDSIKDMIFLGGFKENEKLPSIRELSTTLTVNPNTVSKAYSILEKDEAIYPLTGKGYFVNPKYKSKLIKERKEKIEKEIESIIKDAMKIGLKEDDILNMIKATFIKRMEGELYDRG